MKNLTLITLAGILALCLLIPVFAAQGNGGGCGARAGKQGQACPRGNTQTDGAQAGWWNMVKPTTPEQTAFVSKVKALHEQIRTKQLEIAKLQKNSANKDTVTKAQDDLKALQASLQTLMNENRALRQQMGGAGNGRNGKCQGARGGRCSN